MRVAIRIVGVAAAIYLLGLGAHASELGDVTAVKLLPNGVEVHAGAAAMRVEALRDDVLRVRATPDSVWQEDASWAVLPESKAQTVAVTPFSDAKSAGFDTKLLHVIVERNPMRLVVEDKSGNIVNADAAARPVQFHGQRDAQGGEFRVWKTMGDDEHFFGLGDKTGPLDRRNEAFTDWNTDAYLFQESTDPLYKSIPFFIDENEGRYTGIYLDNTWRASFDFGKELRTAYSFGSDGGPLDYYILYGPGPKQVVENYAWLTGPSPLPPLWSLGYQQSRYSYAPQQKLREVADRLRADKFPADVLWLDIDYQDRDRPFTFDPVGYKDMPKLIADMKAMHFHVVAICDLHVADAPNQGYTPYDTGAAGDHFVKTANGSVYVGESWPGKVVFPDYTQKAAREWWGTNYKGFVDMGLSGFWNDMNEPSIRNEISGTMPLDTVHRIDGTGFAPRTATHREAHNIFGAQNARGTYEGVLKLNPNERPYVMTRAAFAGAQRYSVTWTGDNSATWNHLRMTTSMLENLGLSGYAFAGADVGGHIGSPSPELLTKWLEIASFQPIERDHASKASLQQEPWVNGPEMEAKARKFIELRYRLMPYIYTMAEETSRTGLPMIRPLFMEFPTATRDLHPIDLDAPGEFMWGADLLIAEPTLLEFRSAYSPKLPGDLWYDFWTGAKYAQPHAAEEAAGPNRALAMESKSERKKINGVGAGIHLQANLDDVPVYVRGGAIIPMQAVVQDTEEKPQGPLELRVYPGDNCGGSLYIDDGHTFNYRNGEYLRVQYACTVSDGGVSVSIGKREGGYAPWWTQVEVVVFGAQAGWKASVNGSELAGNYDAAMHAMHVIVPESTAGSTINFRSK